MNTMTYEPTAGTRIAHAIAHALNLSRRYSRPVSFRFNGTRIIARKRLSARHLLRQWEHSNAAASLAFRRSPKYAAQQLQDAANLANAQTTVAALLAMLPTVSTLDGMMAWLHGFTLAADRVGVLLNTHALADYLEAKGYRGNEFVGRADELTVSENLGRYIVGQAITCLRHGMPPHPVTERFIHDYLVLQKQETDAIENHLIR